MDTPTTLLRPDAVMERRGCKKTQLHLDVKRGLMPPPIKRGYKFAFWPSYEIEAINRAEIAGASEEERRALVAQLIEQRAAFKPEIKTVTDQVSQASICPGKTIQI